MWIWKAVKFIGRLLVDFLFILVGVIAAAYVLTSFGLIGAIIMAIPVWYALAWIYSRLQSVKSAAA